MIPALQVFVSGSPAGQPRTKASARGRFVTVYTPKTVKDKATGKYKKHPAEVWKAAIADEWRRSAATHQKTAQPVCLTLSFFMPRPKSHFNSKGELKASAPRYFAKKPDADNMAKAVMDALTQLQAWDDDDQVVILKVSKQYAEGASGCAIILKEADPI